MTQRQRGVTVTEYGVLEMAIRETGGRNLRRQSHHSGRQTGRRGPQELPPTIDFNTQAEGIYRTQGWQDILAPASSKLYASVGQ